MPRLTITFSTDMFNQLQENAAQKHIPIAHYVRDLVNIGLRVEEAAAKKTYVNAQQKDECEALGNDKILWENNLAWLLESLHLIRYLIRSSTHDGNLSTEENKNLADEIIAKAKEKAQVHLTKLWNAQ